MTMTKTGAEQKAAEMVAAIQEGGVITSPNGMVRVDALPEREMLAWTMGRNKTETTIPAGKARLANYKLDALEAMLVMKPDEAKVYDEANKAKTDKKLKELKVDNAKTTEKKASNGKAKAKAEKVSFPELPELEGVGQDEVSIKTNSYPLGKSDYTVKVHRTKDKAETYTALYKGKPIESKARAHKVIRAMFPYHASKRRRGYDVIAGESTITAKPNGGSTEKAASKPKKELVVPDGYAVVEGGSLKIGHQVHDLGGGAKNGSVPEGEGVVEKITDITKAAPGKGGQEYVKLHLERVDKAGKGATRTKFLSKAKKVVAKAGAKAPAKKATKPKAAPKAPAKAKAHRPKVQTVDVGDGPEEAEGVDAA